MKFIWLSRRVDTCIFSGDNLSRVNVASFLLLCVFSEEKWWWWQLHVVDWKVYLMMINELTFLSLAIRTMMSSASFWWAIPKQKESSNWTTAGEKVKAMLIFSVFSFIDYQWHQSSSRRREKPINQRKVSVWFPSLPVSFSLSLGIWNFLVTLSHLQMSEEEAAWAVQRTNTIR